MTVRAAKGCSAIARVGEYVSELIAEITQIIGTIAIMVSFCEYYVVLIIGASFLCYKLDQFVIQKRYENEKKGNTAERKIDYFLKNMLDARTGKELRLFEAGGLFCSKYAEAEKEVYQLNCKTNFVSLCSKAINVVVMAGEIALLYWLAAQSYRNGQIQLGDISVSISTVIVFTKAFNAVFKSMSSISLMGKRIHDFEYYQKFDVEDWTTGGSRSIEEKDIVFEFLNVSYSYPGSEKEILHNINLTIKKGDKLAIVGENGAGKTIFVKLLLRLYVPTSGQILLNGMDYLQYDQEQYYKLFSTVFQDFMIFAYTFWENIMFNDERNEETEHRVEEILDKLGLKEKVLSFPEKQDTYITQNYDMSGVDLSGGEKQRVAIARAWYKNSSFVVMDEPTSAIDPIAEEKLFDRIEEFIREKTVVMISHRLSSVRLCNRILFFQNGIIKEEGIHEELMAAKKDYYMYQAQAQWYAK